jgi:hypothetical protein
MRRLRFSLLALSVLFLATSLYVLLYSDRGGGSLVAFLHEETPEERQVRDNARAEALRQSDKDFAARLRADGLSRVSAADFENGRTRLDHAATLDPEGEQEADVIKARNAIRLAHVDDELAR